MTRQLSPAPSRQRRRLSLAPALAALLLAAGSGVAAAAGDIGEVTDRAALRVCADPANLPFSNEAGEGYENKIAEMIAGDLGLPLQYTWFPQVIGFVRNTLAAKACDLIVGVATTNELMQNTNPYFRSTYALIHRAEVKVGEGGLMAPELADLRIGVVARTPPVTVLAQRGLLGNTKAYPLMVDTRHQAPAKRMAQDVAAGRLDVGILWGPMAGYWAQQSTPPLVVEPLRPDPKGPRLDFRISMGLRYGEPEWKLRLNDILARRKGDIQAILHAYGVPQLDEAGEPLAGGAQTAGN